MVGFFLLGRFAFRTHNDDSVLSALDAINIYMIIKECQLIHARVSALDLRDIDDVLFLSLNSSHGSFLLFYFICLQWFIRSSIICFLFFVFFHAQTDVDDRGQMMDQRSAMDSTMLRTTHSTIMMETTTSSLTMMETTETQTQNDSHRH